MFVENNSKKNKTKKRRKKMNRYEFVYKVIRYASLPESDTIMDDICDVNFGELEDIESSEYETFNGMVEFKVWGSTKIEIESEKEESYEDVLAKAEQSMCEIDFGELQNIEWEMIDYYMELDIDDEKER